MSKFDVHSIETAPEKSKPLLEGAKKAFGFVPNLLGVFAESPAALEAYLSVSTAFGKSDLTAAEQQVHATQGGDSKKCAPQDNTQKTPQNTMNENNVITNTTIGRGRRAAAK